MSEVEPAHQSALIKQSLRMVARMKDELAAERAARNEPIAVVGAGCRVANADGLEQMWSMLVDGVDGVTEVPSARFDVDAFYSPDLDEPGKIASRWGSFISDVYEFDADFFGITRREAEALDPQQRLLLVLSHEALQHAGVPADSLRGSETGVFVSVGPSDYSHLAMLGNWSAVDPYYSTGGALSTASGRISYWLGLHGPNMVVDSGCSSSLVSVHLASESLRRGECDVALAGGVNLILSPYSTLVISKLRALSPDGRCRTFDAGASGFTRGEGGGMVVLKRRRDALADGDRILGLILGSAVNHGGTASGLTAPNPVAQRAVIEAAMRNAGVEPSRVGYIEAHGTATALGDLIEIEALKAALGDRGNAPLHLGSIKTNIGHLEAGAGIVGLLKAMLATRHGVVPPHLHLREPNPRLGLAEAGITVPTEPLPWGRPDAPRVAGVSSFGVGGTNCHVVLGMAPPVESAAQTQFELAGRKRAPEFLALPLSAQSEKALAELATQVAATLGRSRDAEALCHEAAHRRSHLQHRMVAVAETATDLQAAVAAFGAGEPSAAVRAESAATRARTLAWVMSGHGGQWLGMGRALRSVAPFRAALGECDEAVRRQAGWSIIDELMAEPGESRLERFDVSQPLIMAIEVALAALLRAWGPAPDIVVGHSVGEVAAAHVAGILTLDDAVRVVVARSRLMQRTVGRGGMMVVELNAADAQAMAREIPNLSSAAFNSPSTTVVSGDENALAAAERVLAAKHVFFRRVNVPIPAHSALMEPLGGELLTALRGLTPASGRIPLVSTVTGDVVDGADMGPEYWFRNMRQPVRFTQAVAGIAASGGVGFVELGPHPTLLTAVDQCMADAAPPRSCWCLGTLRRDESDLLSVMQSLGELHCRGHRIEWSEWQKAHPFGAQLPRTPWQNQTYISQVVSEALEKLGGATGDDGWYQLEWQPQVVSNAETESGPICVLADRGGIGKALADVLRSRGVSCITVARPDDPAASNADAVGPADESDWIGLRDALVSGRIKRIVNLWPVDIEKADEPGLSAAIAQTLGAIQAANASETEGLAWWTVTRGAQAVADSSALRPAQAVFWGLGRVLASEQPSWTTGLLDIDEKVDATALADEICAPPRAEQAAFRGATRFVARLGHAPPVRSTSTVTLVRADATYLVTGGLGGIGLCVAGWLAEQGASRVCLLSRRAVPTASAAEAIAAMETRGCRVELVAADVTDAAALTTGLREIVDEERPLRGVLHCAGVLEDGLLEGSTREQFARVLGPKVSGTVNLDRTTRDAPLDFFVLFSAGAALMGPPGQANYAAANAFMDTFAHARRAQGRPAVSINWGVWADVGLAAAAQNRGARLSAMGVSALRPAQGVAALATVLRTPTLTQVAVMPMDWGRFAKSAPGPSSSPLIAELVVRHGARERTPLEETAEGRAYDAASLNALAESERRLVVDGCLEDLLRAALRVSADTVFDGDQPLNQLGLDSLMALETRTRLQRRLGVRVSTADLLAGASKDDMVDKIIDSLEMSRLVASVQADEDDDAPASSQQLDTMTI